MAGRKSGDVRRMIARRHPASACGFSECSLGFCWRSAPSSRPGQRGWRRSMMCRRTSMLANTPIVAAWRHSALRLLPSVHLASPGPAESSSRPERIGPRHEGRTCSPSSCRRSGSKPERTPRMSFSLVRSLSRGGQQQTQQDVPGVCCATAALRFSRSRRKLCRRPAATDLAWRWVDVCKPDRVSLCRARGIRAATRAGSF